MFFGDFNVILGAHEHQGSTTPARPPVIDFQNWTDVNDLLHIPTKGAELTWNNGRHTKRRLDRAVCNQLWIDTCTSISCSTLAKQRSDHYPLLLDLTVNSTQIASYFKFVKMWTLNNDCKDIIASF